MTEAKDVRLDTFILALRRLHLTHVQISNFQDRSRTEIRSERHSDAEYSISWIEQLKQDLPGLQMDLAKAYGALDPVLKSELCTLIGDPGQASGRPH